MRLARYAYAALALSEIGLSLRTPRAIAKVRAAIAYALHASNGALPISEATTHVT